jgi:hypothetical protein
MFCIHILCQPPFAPPMHACILLMMLVMMTLLMLRVMMCNLYKLFVLAIHSTSSPPVTTISGAKKNIEVNYDSITSCQSNHKYNSDNEIYQFFVRCPHFHLVLRHPLTDRS